MKRATPIPRRLGDLQLKILKVLWAREQATVAQVLEDLTPARSLAYTTVATMLRKMEERGLVSHSHEGRTFVYHPTVGADAVTRSLADDLVDRLFGGSLTATVSHLLTTREVRKDELASLESLIAERKKRS